ncbi:MAG: hypothetical protein C0504_20240 [Candidatus Solibacter sp.]|nr:hypothetical protein [Candidatus Solibacter sp.]
MYQGRDAYLVECLICGTYAISRTAAVNLSDSHDELLPWLSCHTRQVWEEEARPFEILTTNWRSMAELHKSTSLSQKLDKLLKVAERRTEVLGSAFRFDHGVEFPLLDAISHETAGFLILHAIEMSLLSQPHAGGVYYKIGFAGWQYIERTGLSSQAPARVFVAMSFKPELNPAYDDGIKPAVENDCLLSCYRIDREEHNDKICDRILADIRRSHIVVADFTNNAAGVYFEAGFGLALGKTVIWSVREDHLKDVHFDTRQYNHIVWKNPEDLRTSLRDRIQAKFQDAVNRSHGPSR